MFASILIANRGEIAVRIMQTCREMGIECIAVYSDADAGAYHVRNADRAYRIGEAAPRDSYLSISAIVDAAVESGAEAVHPGYGFLAENADFAVAVLASGIAWIGPPPSVIALLGDKVASKRAAQEAGVPVVPGYDGPDFSLQRLEVEARAIGYPVMLKAAAGGGGKGMRIVHTSIDLEPSLGAARREAVNAFGDDTVFLEKLLRRPRHIEIQVAADNAGTMVYLGERDCSLQRRHQKVVEEAPSPIMDSALRAEMGESALRIAKACGYRNLGTVEFLVADGRYYFLEVNTRIQVEHPVTEAVTGLDLVRLQLAIASGDPLPISQRDVDLTGHAIEARVYAEDAQAHFVPATGTVRVAVAPTGPGIRTDLGVQSGDDVSVFYDPMIAKVIVHAETRPLAVAKLRNALEHFQVEGLTTNIPFLRWISTQRDFVAGDTDVEMIDREWHGIEDPPVPAVILVALALWEAIRPRVDGDPWRSSDAWRMSGAPRPMRYASSGQRFHVEAAKSNAATWRVSVNGTALAVHVQAASLNAVTFLLGNEVHTASVYYERDEFHVLHRGVEYVLARQAAEESARAGIERESRESILKAPMPGTILKVNTQPGAQVVAFQPLIVLEAMKMEHVVEAPAAGTIRSVSVQPGDVVAAGATLLHIDGIT